MDDGINIQSGAVGSQVLNNVVAGSTAGDGIEINAAGSGTILRGNLVGLNASGTSALANRRTGIYVPNTPGVTIGGSTLADRNVIAASTLFIGVHLSNSSNSTIQNNFIGTNQAGSSSMPNGGESGLLLDGGTSNTQVIGNLISGNSGAGAIVRGSGTNNNILTGNIVGLNAAGTAALGNGAQGIVVRGGASGTRIGTNGDGVNDSAERNVVSANNADGIMIVDIGTNATVIAGNYVGTDTTGQLDRGNAFSESPFSEVRRTHALVRTAAMMHLT